MCTCHDSSCVKACANLWHDWMIILQIRGTYIFSSFRLGAHKRFMKAVSGRPHESCSHCSVCSTSIIPLWIISTSFSPALKSAISIARQLPLQKDINHGISWEPLWAIGDGYGCYDNESANECWRNCCSLGKSPLWLCFQFQKFWLMNALMLG